MADADATLGGSLNVNASLKDPSAGDEAPIRIGAQGVLNVTEDEFEVIAENGSVDIFGGNGLNIKNDLTIVSVSDSSLTSERGLIDIGNKATVKAGTQSGLSQENPLYGKSVSSPGKASPSVTRLKSFLTICWFQQKKIFDSAIRPRLSARQRESR